MKKIISNHRYLMAFMLLIIGSLFFLIWLVYDYVYTLNRSAFELGERIAFASLWVSIIGFGLAITGAFIAVMQFQAEQRKPDLFLWVNKRNDQEVYIDPANRSPKINIILENRGKGVGRFVKINLEIPLTFSKSLLGTANRVKLIQDASGFSENHWELLRTDSETIAGFIGRETFISYDNDWEIVGIFLLDWMDDDILEPRYYLKYNIRCEGMKKRSGTLIILTENENQPPSHA